MMGPWLLDTPWSQVLNHAPDGESLVLGLMSGTSLDGLDCCLARIAHSANLPWCFEMVHADTYPYPVEWQERLRQSPCLLPTELMALDTDLGVLWGKWVLDFLEKYRLSNPGQAGQSGQASQPLLIGSHGHTVCHNPASGYSLQIGSAAHLHAITGLPIVHNFRNGDIARGGQGAPLVPIGDALLFGDYHGCLNLGGIANISWGPAPTIDKAPFRQAFDLTFCNTALNFFASLAGLSMDADGRLAAQGEPRDELLERWSSASWYQIQGARSLDTTAFQEQFWTTGLSDRFTPQDLCYNWCLHLAQVLEPVISKISGGQPGKILVSGGGTAHPVLMRCLQHKSDLLLIQADPMVRDFKEALIFGLLGLLHYFNLPNVLGHSTGADFNHRSGARIG
jgi:anhydro-N-acetylmuramic acid kinase